MHLPRVRELFFVFADPTRIYRLNYWMYVYTGFWQLSSDKKWKLLFYNMYRLAICFVCIISIYSYFSDAINVGNNLDKLSFNMSNNVLVIITILKVIFLRIRSAKVESLLTNLDNHLNIESIGRSTDDKKIFKKRAMVIVRINRVLYGLLVVSFILRVIADTNFATKAYLIPLPFKAQMDAHYEIVYAQQVLIGMHFLGSVIAHDLLIYGIVNRFISHFEVLKKNFLTISHIYPRMNFEKYVRDYADSCGQNIALSDVLLRKSFLTKAENVNDMRDYVNENDRLEITEKTARHMLKKNIYHHQELLKEIMNFTEIYSSPFIIQASAAVIITGIVAIKILFMPKQLTPLLLQQLIYVGINLVNNLFLCTLGSALTNKSIAAADALYGVPWYAMGAENRRIIHFAMKKLLAGPRLKGGGLVIINRVTYLKFLQTSYNMVVLLRNLYKA